jgi:hypothetical protein
MMAWYNILFAFFLLKYMDVDDISYVLSAASLTTRLKCSTHCRLYYEDSKSNSETSSTSIHIKRNKAKKNVVPDHRPVTRIQMDSSKDKCDSNCAESHDPLRDGFAHNSDNELKYNANNNNLMLIQPMWSKTSRQMQVIG